MKLRLRIDILHTDSIQCLRIESACTFAITLKESIGVHACVQIWVSRQRIAIETAKTSPVMLRVFTLKARLSYLTALPLVYTTQAHTNHFGDPPSVYILIDSSVVDIYPDLGTQQYCCSRQVIR